MQTQVSIYRRLERIVKGFSNHRRIQMMNLLDQSPELSLEEVAQKLRINFRTASEHLRRMAIAELIEKRNEGRKVRHKLSDRGHDILTFLRKLE